MMYWSTHILVTGAARGLVVTASLVDLGRDQVDDYLIVSSVWNVSRILKSLPGIWRAWQLPPRRPPRMSAPVSPFWELQQETTWPLPQTALPSPTLLGLSWWSSLLLVGAAVEMQAVATTVVMILEICIFAVGWFEAERLER